MRAVVDTSTAFSALAFRGKPYHVLEALLSSEEWDVVLSSPMADELQEALIRKGRGTPVILTLYRRYLARTFRMDVTAQIERLCRNPEDDFVLACALSADAQILVASDKDLLSLSAYAQLKLRMSGGHFEIIDVNEAYERFCAGR